jgi:hypothetical protein
VPTIAILDDRPKDRETITRVVVSTLKKIKEDKDWGVICEEPPQRERDVIQWLDENDATVLMSDWKLNEGTNSNRVVNYEADKLIREIRDKRPNFPIYIITGYESEARVHLREVENILSRKDFTRDAHIVIPQMIRAGRRRYEEQRGLLSKMDSLARRIAVGRASAKDKKELRSLQGYFQAELPTMIDLDQVLVEFENAKTKAEALRKRVHRRLNQIKREK